jgi:hypothetical protein
MLTCIEVNEQLLEPYAADDYGSMNVDDHGGHLLRISAYQHFCFPRQKIYSANPAGILVFLGLYLCYVSYRELWAGD